MSIHEVHRSLAAALVALALATANLHGAGGSAVAHDSVTESPSARSCVAPSQPNAHLGVAPRSAQFPVGTTASIEADGGVFRLDDGDIATFKVVCGPDTGESRRVRVSDHPDSSHPNVESAYLPINNHGGLGTDLVSVSIRTRAGTRGPITFNVTWVKPVDCGKPVKDLGFMVALQCRVVNPMLPHVLNAVQCGIGAAQYLVPETKIPKLIRLLKAAAENENAAHFAGLIGAEANAARLVLALKEVAESDGRGASHFKAVASLLYDAVDFGQFVAHFRKFIARFGSRAQVLRLGYLLADIFGLKDCLDLIGFTAHYNPLPTIKNTQLPAAAYGHSYKATLETVDNRPGLWSISGVPPEGILLKGSHLLGTTHQVGKFQLTVRFTDKDKGVAAKKLLLTVAAPPPSPVSLPFRVINNSGVHEPTFIYVMARDQSSTQQGYVDAGGTWHAFELPASVPPGTANPAAPDTSIAGTATGAATTLHLPRGLVGGRIYVSIGERLQFFLTPNGLVEPAAWTPSDPNHDVLFDWTEFARDGSHIFINTTAVDMFSVPLKVTVNSTSGESETTGALVAGGRARIFQLLSNLGGDWAKLIYRRPGDSTPLRAIAPIHAIDAGTFNPSFFRPYVDDVWTYYATHDLTVSTSLGSFKGRTTGDGFVFRNAYGIEVGRFTKPSSSEILACYGAIQPGGQPSVVASLAIGARLCAAFNRATLSTNGRRASDNQPTYDPSLFYNQPISNLYSRVIHKNEVDGKAYGFAFDDVAEFSPSINSDYPSSASMTMTPFN